MRGWSGLDKVVRREEVGRATVEEIPGAVPGKVSRHSFLRAVHEA